MLIRALDSFRSFFCQHYRMNTCNFIYCSVINNSASLRLNKEEFVVKVLVLCSPRVNTLGRNNHEAFLEIFAWHILSATRCGRSWNYIVTPPVALAEFVKYKNGLLLFESPFCCTCKIHRQAMGIRLVVVLQPIYYLSWTEKNNSRWRKRKTRGGGRTNACDSRRSFHVVN